MPRYPNTPFRVPDETPVCDRVAIMTNLTSEGTQSQLVRQMAKAAYTRAQKLWQQFEQASSGDPDMQRAMQTQDWRRRILALEILRAVQSLPYCKNPPGEEWMQCADYTINNCGDCKALSILFAAVARVCGFRAEPYWVTQTGQEINHVTGRVWIDRKDPFLADGSIRGAMLGESPYEAEPRLGSNVVGVAPAGKAGGGGHGHGGGGFHGGGGRHVFGWWGWDGIWPGWPAWWWCTYYPYLCGGYSQLIAYPFAYGFYPNVLVV